MTETEIMERKEALKTEARGLTDALRPLLGVEALGGDLLTDDERERMERIRERLAEIRAEADELGRQRREAHAERKRKAREAEERRRQDLEDRRTKTERENALINRIVTARRNRSYEVGLGGINAGGQPKGSAAAVPLARKVEGEIAELFDAEAEVTFGFPARYVRNLADDEAFGIHLDHATGSLAAGPPALRPTQKVTSPIPMPHQDWSGPSIPYLD